MSEPTRQEIIDAYEALERLEKAAWKGSQNDYEEEYHTEGKDLILQLLPPKPALTMADVVWDEDKCFLAEAEHYKYGKVVMLKKDPFAGNITVLYKDEDGFNDLLCTNSKYLTPTDTKYVLKEVY